MTLNKDSLIEYTIEDKNGEKVKMTFTMEQIEGSVPNFYSQVKESLKEPTEDEVPFDVENSEIISRKIINKEEK